MSQGQAAVDRINDIVHLKHREEAIITTATQLLFSGHYGWRDAILEAEAFVDEVQRRAECVDRAEKPYTHPYNNKFDKEEGGDDGEDNDPEEERD